MTPPPWRHAGPKLGIDHAVRFLSAGPRGRGHRRHRPRCNRSLPNRRDINHRRRRTAPRLKKRSRRPTDRVSMIIVSPDPTGPSGPNSPRRRATPGAGGQQPQPRHATRPAGTNLPSGSRQRPGAARPSAAPSNAGSQPVGGVSQRTMMRSWMLIALSTSRGSTPSLRPRLRGRSTAANSPSFGRPAPALVHGTMHRDTDELLFALEGSVTIELFGNSVASLVAPRGRWHRHVNAVDLVELSHTPGQSLGSDEPSMASENDGR